MRHPFAAKSWQSTLKKVLLLVWETILGAWV